MRTSLLLFLIFCACASEPDPLTVTTSTIQEVASVADPLAEGEAEIDALNSNPYFDMRGLVWESGQSFPGPSGLELSSAAFAYYGTKLAACYRGDSGQLRFFTTFDENSTIPLQVTPAMQNINRCAVAGAPLKEAWTAITQERATATAPLNVFVRGYSTDQVQAHWQYTFPTTLDTSYSGLAVGAKINRDGTVAVAFAQDIWNYKFVLVKLDGITGAQQGLLQVSGAIPYGAHITDDGNTLLFAVNMTVVVVDLPTFTVRSTIYAAAGVRGFAASNDGSRIALALDTGRVDLYALQGSAYSPFFSIDNPGFSVSGVALSADGARLSFGRYNPSQAGVLDLRVFEVSAAHPQLYAESFAIGGAGATTNFRRIFLGVEDGRYWLAATINASATNAPRLLLAREHLQDTGWQTEWSDLNGLPAWDIFSDGGQRLLVGRSGTGAPPNYPLSVSAQLYDFALHRDLRIVGRPTAGAVITVQQKLAAGSVGRLLGAPYLALPPVLIPGSGTLYLDPNNMTIVASGTMNAQGIVNYSLALPTTIGTEVNLQGRGRLATSILTRTFLPLKTLMP